MTNQFLSDLMYFPKLGRGIQCVWRRNFLYFRQTILTSVVWIFAEPLLYLFALGYGLGRFVNQVDGMSYAGFISPSMMATSGMFVAFFEGTFGTYTKLTRQNTYQTIILTPVSPDEVVMGEIAWVTTKAFISVLSVTIVLTLMGLVPLAGLAPALFVLFLMCWVFAAIGLWMASLAKSWDWFTYFQSGFIMPMSLFCGTYFPLAQLPKYLGYFAYTLPLTHVMLSVRMFLHGDFSSTCLINIIYLIVLGLVFTNLAVARFGRRLVI